MQYAMYLLIWEKSYGKDDILCAIPGKMSTKSEERCMAKKKGLEMLAISRETFRVRRYEKAKKMIDEHRDILDKCASLLLEKEKISKDEFGALFND